MAGKEYQMAFTIGAKLQGQFGAAFKGAQNSVQGLQNQIQALNKRQGDISSYQKTQQAIEKTTQRLERYKAQYAALQAEIQKNGTATDAQLTKEAQLGQQINATQDKLTGYQQKLDATGASLAEAGVDTSNLAAESQKLGQDIENLKGQQEELANANQNVVASMAEMAGAIGIGAALKEAGEALKACAEAAMEYESAMAGVKRTVGGSDEFLAQMSADFKQMSTQIPITANELAQIATTAGQLGVAQENVKSFTETMARLATATDLTADEAATMLAQFSNITGVKDFERIGAVVAELGDATATTASKVVQMSQGMAASANLAGMSANDIMAISAAVGSLGIEAQAGSTAMSTLINTLFKATETGEKLQEFASVAGMSAEEFKQAWASNAVGAMNAFITGLNDVERNGKSAIVILDELGINNVRQTKAILGLASAGDLLSNTIAQANAAWESNTALTDKAGIMYQTAEAKVTMMQNAFTNVKTAIGEAFTPSIAAGADALTGLMQPVAEFIEANPQLVQAFTAEAGVIGAVTGALALYTLGAKAAAIASAALTAAIPGAKLILGITAGVAALAGAIAALTGTHVEAQVTLSDLTAEFNELGEQIEEQQKIIDLADKYKKLTTQIDNTVKVTKDLDFSDIDISVSAKAQETVEPDDFMIDGNHDVTIEGEADKENLLGADEFADVDDNIIYLYGEKAEDNTDLSGDDFIGDQNVHLYGEKAEDAEDLNGDDFIGDSGADIYGRPAEEQTLTGDELVADPNANIIGEAAEKQTLTGDELIADDTASITGEAAEKQTLTGDKLLSDNTATVEGKAPTTKSLNGDDLVGEKGVHLYAKEPTGEAKLKAQVFVDGREIHFDAKFDNYDDMVAQVENLKTRAKQAKQDLTDAQSTLDALNQEKGFILERQKHASTDLQKSNLQVQLEEVNKAIEEQQGKVSTLQTQYENLGTEYLVTKSAAEAWKKKQDDILAVEQQIAAATSGTAGSIEEQAKAIKLEAEAQEALIKAKRAELALKAQETIGQQAVEYARAATQYQESAKVIDRATQQINNIDGPESLNDQLNGLIGTMAELMSYENENPLDWNSKEIKGYRKEVEALMSEATGIPKSYGSFDMMKREVRALATEENAAEYATVSLGEEIQAAAAKQAEAEAQMQSFVDSTVAMIEAGLDATEVEQQMRLSLQEAGQDASIVDSIMEQVNKQLTEHQQAAEAAAESAEDLSDAETDVQDQQIATVIKEQTEELQKLAEAYQLAYEEAYKSMDGQFKLFEKMDEVKPSENAGQAVQDMLDALTSQQKYIADYQKNLKTVKDMGLSQEIVSQLSDGSKESAQILADIAKGGADKIKDLNTAFAQVQSGKESFATQVAEMETDFEATMNKISEKVNTAVGEMDKAGEAASAGAATGQAFADALSAKSSIVNSAGQKLGKAALEGLLAGFTKLNIPGFASGTTDAPPGAALVGEHGPEIMLFRGGEQVIDAEHTQDILSRSNNAESALSTTEGSTTRTLEYKPTYTFTGNTNADDLQRVLEEHDQNLRATIEDLIDEIETDNGRRRYA